MGIACQGGVPRPRRKQPVSNICPTAVMPDLAKENARGKVGDENLDSGLLLLIRGFSLLQVLNGDKGKGSVVPRLSDVTRLLEDDWERDRNYELEFTCSDSLNQRLISFTAVFCLYRF